ncbi:MAG TPA: hypothetical protein VE777_09045 [Gaiellales bacterium]|nr:hypothetical protein [Gaiellales bacterium]
MCTAKPPTFPSISPHSPVDAGAQFEDEIAHSRGDVQGASDGAGRAVEPREEPVARHIELLLAPAPKELARNGVVSLQQLAPTAIPELHRPCRGVDDVGEHDRGEDTIEERVE